MNERIGAAVIIGSVVAGAIVLAKVSRAQPPPDVGDISVRWGQTPASVTSGETLRFSVIVVNNTDASHTATIKRSFVRPDGSQSPVVATNTLIVPAYSEGEFEWDTGFAGAEPGDWVVVATVNSTRLEFPITVI